MNMDMNICGSGIIPPGKYNQVRTNGSAKLQGLVQCQNFYASGSCKGESLVCEQTCKTSGSISFSRNVTAKFICGNGSFSCQGNVNTDLLQHSGSFKCQGKIKCQQLITAGCLHAENGIEAESFCLNGAVQCPDLINGESIEIRFFEGMKIGSVGGSNILFASRRNFLKRIFKKSAIGKIQVASTIEGDQINIEHTHCPLVTGRKVTIGKGCQIDLVEYSHSLEIHPKAKVIKAKKI